MHFAVTIHVAIPLDLDPGERADIVARERRHSQELQRAGKWLNIWRIVGTRSSLSIFDVESPDELHEILSGLPLYKYMTVEVTALGTHPAQLSGKELS